MGLRDLIKKKDAIAPDAPRREDTLRALNGPEFQFIRTDTLSHEVLHPPDHPVRQSAQLLSAATKEPSRARRNLDVFRPSRSRSASASSIKSSHQQQQHLTTGDDGSGNGNGSGEGGSRRRLSHRLHLSRAPASSENVPMDLPQIVIPSDPGDREGAESQWEARATRLAEQNERARSRPGTPAEGEAGPVGHGGLAGSRERSQTVGRAAMSSQAIDADIQEAIRLHEGGDLEQSTRLFERLADPNGANNPLSQVLFGLALRHGWGCQPDPARAVHYLSAAASNAASIEQSALQAGMKKGGTAKGELVLAIFELANCFRHGWGIPEDAVAAKQYYETAANLGDTDAMNEAGWCYVEGYGCKKDRYAAARYYRLAEKAGSKTLGNSWIWKDKYNSPEEGGGKKK